MVSNARLDFPEPERPVTTVSRLRGISRVKSLRLCWRAPRIVILSIAMKSRAQIEKNCRESRTFHFHGWVGRCQVRIKYYPRKRLCEKDVRSSAFRRE